MSRWVESLVRNALTPDLSSSSAGEERKKPLLVAELRNNKWREGTALLRSFLGFLRGSLRHLLIGDGGAANLTRIDRPTPRKMRGGDFFVRRFALCALSSGAARALVFIVCGDIAG